LTRLSARPAETAEKPFAPPLENDNDWENGFSFGKSRFFAACPAIHGKFRFRAIFYY
jgi:hypothetical protein